MAHAAPITSTTAMHHVAFDRMIGMALVTIVPAIFWTVIASLVCASFGIALSLAALGGIALFIAAFLAVIFRALSVNSTTSG
ncbi:MAG: hypothetical protein K0U34_04550 [Alphaproteobacteria bacterium]|nr:hypothetical protein [Alphaproteobacteria bacterium]